MLKKLVYCALALDLYSSSILIYERQSCLTTADIGIVILLLIVFFLPSFLIVCSVSLIYFIFSPIVRELFWISQQLVRRRKSKTRSRRLVRFLLTEEDEENIIGDLREEYLQFHSKSEAHLWLYKQVLKSIAPLIYKTAKSRLASYLGERVR